MTEYPLFLSYLEYLTNWLCSEIQSKSEQFYSEHSKIKLDISYKTTRQSPPN